MSDFTWTSPDGKSVTLPSLNSVPGGVLRRHRKLEELDFLFSVLEDVATDEQIEAVDAVGLGDLNNLFAAWQKDATVSVPQS